MGICITQDVTVLYLTASVYREAGHRMLRERGMWLLSTRRGLRYVANGGYVSTHPPRRFEYLGALGSAY
eukprot:711404-Pyramimonas_sp.AAC.1